MNFRRKEQSLFNNLMKNKEYIKTDVVIVGSGVAGLFAALCHQRIRKFLLYKGKYR